MEDKNKQRLVDLNLKAFIDEITSGSPLPGGGSVSAYTGTMGVALGIMCANLSNHKKDREKRRRELSGLADKGRESLDKLLKLVDEDTTAYSKLLEAKALPRGTKSEIAKRNDAIMEATRSTIRVPFEVLHTAFSAFKLIREVVEKGNPNSAGDAGNGALALLSCIRGSCLNIRINCNGLADKAFATDMIEKSSKFKAAAIKETEAILKIVESVAVKGRMTQGV